MTVIHKLYYWFSWSLIVGLISYVLVGCQSIDPEMRKCIDKCGRDYIKKTYPIK